MGPEAPHEWTLLPPFQAAEGELWQANLPLDMHPLTDTNGHAARSRLRLFEDAQELGPGHSLHESIISKGGGGYSFWKDTLYFSTPDGSDPNVNGRLYRVRLEEAHSNASLDLPIAPSVPEWISPSTPLRCAVLGMGNRGLHLARMAQSYAGIEIAWVVDVSQSRLEQAVGRLGREGIVATSDWRLPIADPNVDIVFVTLPDFLHRPAAEAAFRAGKHVYLEKPIATNVPDARAILDAWRHSERVLQLGYVLRQTPFYRAIREVVRTGLLGPVRMVTTSEQLDVRHGASFMRRWHSNSAHSGGLLVHKCCHDLDVICWLLDSRPRRIASFGGSSTFARPAPAVFCSQCGERDLCPYVDKGTHESRTSDEQADPSAYGLDRCVFNGDKDIVDNQVVSFELASGTRGSHHLTVQGRRTERRISLVGDAARLDGILEDGAFTVEFAASDRESVQWSAEGTDSGSHQGGDSRTMRDFLEACMGGAQVALGTSGQIMAGLVFAIAAEEARTTTCVVELQERDFSGPGAAEP